MLDNITRILFSSYPREVGKKRNIVKTIEDFEKEIDLFNGVDEVFTNVNPIDGSINKIFIDFDGVNSLVQAQKVYSYAIQKNIPCIPVASGVKGIHLYLLFKPLKNVDHDINKNKLILYKATVSILLKALETFNDSVDTHIIGDLRRLCRVPNTLRPPSNNSYCTYLPPKTFTEMSPNDLYRHIKRPHAYPTEDYNANSYRPTFEKHIDPNIDKFIPKNNITTNQTTHHQYVEDYHLKMLLRECVYRFITVEEPRHFVRVAAAAELKNVGFSDVDILNFFRKLKWVDFDEVTCAYQISTCKPYPYRKKTLKNLGICYECGRSCR